MTAREYAEFCRNVTEFMTRNGIHGFTTVDDSEAEFSWRPCAACGTSLGGDRHACNAYQERSGEVIEFSACGDCVYFAAYGQIGDMDMPEKDAMCDSLLGWALFNAPDDAEIQRDDERGIFASDEDARAHVRDCAACRADLEASCRREGIDAATVLRPTVGPGGSCEVTRENYFDAAQALYWHCVNNHGGQWSDLYRISCALDYHPGASERGIDEGSEAEIFAAALEAGDVDPDALLTAIETHSSQD